MWVLIVLYNFDLSDVINESRLKGKCQGENNYKQICFNVCNNLVKC